MSLEARQLSIRRGDQWILRDIDFVVEPGEIVGIIGANGSGKSTLLSAIAGKCRFSGDLEFNGGSLSDSRSQPATIALISNDSLAPKSGLFRKTARVASGEHLFKAFEAACDGPESILLFDGIFDGMDLDLRHRCLEKLSDRASSRIVIVATTNFEVISQFTKTSIVISAGYSVQTGTPTELYESPETVAVAELTGKTNLVEARRLTSTNADLPEFQTIDGGHRLIAGPAAKRRLGAINQNMILAIRPENVTISMGASFPEDNLLRSVVTGFSFHGATSLIDFDAGGLKLTARVFRVVGLNVGDECMLGISPQQITILQK